MPERFHALTMTDSVLKAQKHYFGKRARLSSDTGPEPLTAEEMLFIQSRDSFYIATVSEAGWPYVQHRGGRPGFLRALGPTELAFADYKGNRQMLSTGNLAENNRVALFLMDYPRRERLKILGHARVVDARERPDLVVRLAESDAQGIVERLFLIDVVAFDWNCPKYITPRYTASEVEKMVAPLRERIAELEAQINERR